MTKKTIGNVISSGIEAGSKKGGLNIEDTVITTPDRIKRSLPRERKEAKSMVYLTTKDMDNFLSRIGRDPFSEAVGLLIKDFLASGKNIKDYIN